MFHQWLNNLSSISWDAQEVHQRIKVHSLTAAESLKDVDIPLETATGGQLYDVLRFFHGDGPAQQFEAGNKIGGNYPCVGCEAHTGRFDDLAYTFRAKHLSLGERQSF